MTTAAPPVQEGDILAGKYRIERVLGVGGMGIVVAAHHVQLEQHVALKFLLPEALENPDIVARFAREARSAAKIQSEHVARVIDVGTLESGSPYMVMEYLDGSDLAQVIYDRGVVPVPEAADFIMQACEAIAEAHAAGIVHRDLKPANLFLAKRTNGRAIVKVLDFGISKVMPKGASRSEDLSLTKTSTLVGSPLYMSPEQMASAKSVDARSDIWALGVILYELVSGFTPFNADSVTEMVAAILQTQPRDLSEVRTDIPPELSAVIMRCLEKDPARRFQSASELAAALWRFVPDKSRASMQRVASFVANSPTLVSPMTSTPPPISNLPISSMKTMPAPPSAGAGMSPISPISPISSTGALPAFGAVASSGIAAPQPMTVTDPTWGRTNGEHKSSAPRTTIFVGAALGMFATVGVIAFIAAFALRSKPPAAGASAPITASAPSAPVPSDAIAIATANGGAPRPAIGDTTADVGASSAAASASANEGEAARPSTSSSSTPATIPPKAHGSKPATPPKPAGSVTPPQAPKSSTDPKLEIRMTR